MPKKQSYPTFTDQFCGAGGSSLGATQALEERGGSIDGIKVALNHWELAIETHNTNFPNALHHCTDVSASDPRIYPSTDFLITSPECTTHTPAGGSRHKHAKTQMELFTSGKIDPATERSRATMWDVCRFAEYHNYNFIITENVIEAKTQWPLFDIWLKAMHVLGYDHKTVYMNSMFCHPTPQSRDRMYVVFWKKGNKAPDLDFMPAAHCPRCDKHVLSVQTWKNPQKRWGKYNREYYYACPGCAKPVTPYYYASFNCIDWSLPGQRIGDRIKPLVENTMKRIRYGYEKYGKTPLVISRGYGHSNQMRARDMSEAMPTQAGDAKHALTSPFMIENFGTSKARGIDERLGCITADGNKYGLLQPFIIQTDHQKAGESYWTTPVDQVLKTQKTWQTAGLVSPFITLNYSPGYSKPLSDSLGSITTQDHHGLVSNERINAFLQYYYGGSDVFAGMNQAARTLTTVDCASLINVRTATSVEDCTYRMLVPHEVQSGMAFDPTYKVLGDWKEKVKQLGNAVTPPAMKQLVGRCLDTIK